MPSDSVATFLEQARELRLMADADLAVYQAVINRGGEAS